MNLRDWTAQVMLSDLSSAPQICAWALTVLAETNGVFDGEFATTPERIAATYNVDVAKCRRHLSVLIRAGWLTREYRQGTEFVYRATVPD